MDPHDGCTGHTHDHEHGEDLGLSLRQYVDIGKVVCYNERIPGSGGLVIKPMADRMIPEPTLQSQDDDPELLLYIPFTEAVSIQSISIYNGTAAAAAASSSSSNESTVTASPRRIKLFTNRDDLDFDTVRELPPQQELELLPDGHYEFGTIDYPCRPAGRFQGISSLTIFIVDNYSTTSNEDDSAVLSTELTYVGLKGKGTKAKRQAVHAVYETQGMREDHKVEGDMFGSKTIL